MKNRTQTIILIFTASIFELLLLFYLKYSMNKISIWEITIWNIGNLLDLSMTAVVLFGAVFHIALKLNLSDNQYKIIRWLSILMILPYLSILFLNTFNIPLPHYTLFFYSFKKISIGVLFLLAKAIQFYLMVLLWSMLFAKKKFSFLKSIYFVAVIFLTLLIFSFIYITVIRDSRTGSDINYSTNIGIILGAAVWSNNRPSPIFKARIQKAYDLYKRGKLIKIQVTGSNAPGEISEAEAAQNLLIDLGVQKQDVLIEKVTSTTSEQIRFIKENILNGNEPKGIVIISDAFHLKRVMEICNFFKVKAVGISSDYKLGWEKYLFYSFRESIGLLLFWIFAI